MTEETRDLVADWHAQFAPPSRVEGPVPVDVAARAETVEHFAGDDGVFTAPVPEPDVTAAEAGEEEHDA